MRVLYFGRFFSPNFGGLERHVELLMEGLKCRIEADNLVANDRYKTEVIKKDGYKIYKVAALGLVAGTPICFGMPYWVRKLYKANHFDIAHLHFPDPLSHIAAYFLPRNVKIVITWHSDIVRQKKLLKLYQPLLNHIVKRADAIIAATPRHFSSSTQLNACKDRKRVFVVPFGIDAKVFERNEVIDSASRSIRQQYSGRKIIFSVGRHVYYKGFEYLIRAMQEVHLGILILAGTGPLTDSLKSLAMSLGLKDKVYFLGRLSDELLASYYHAIDVYCMPSVEPSEAFGLVQLEAMACKRPVVCCELNNGVTYVNQHGITGLVVPPRDPHALSVALNDLLVDDEKRKRMGEAGYARVKKEFTLEGMLEGNMQVYRRVLSERDGENTGDG